MIVELFNSSENMRGHRKRDLWGHNMKFRIMHLDDTLAHEEGCEHTSIHSLLHKMFMFLKQKQKFTMMPKLFTFC